MINKTVAYQIHKVVYQLMNTAELQFWSNINIILQLVGYEFHLSNKLILNSAVSIYFSLRWDR